MAAFKKHVDFAGRMVMVGFGSIGAGVLPLFLRHVGMKADQITVVTSDDRYAGIAKEYGVEHIVQPVTRANYRTLIGDRLKAGDFVCNLSVEVSSVALAELAHEKGALYLDTCIEPWPGGYTDPNLSPSRRSNYALRETMLDLRRRLGPGGPTAVFGHGANPGIVSSFVKQALLNIASDTGHRTDVPKDRAGWGRLARDLGVKVIHIAERDDQIDKDAKQVDEFVNTWSIDGFVSEGLQPAEMGWGTHEKALPPDGRRHDFGEDSAIYLMRPGASTRVRTWTPRGGTLHGWIITHNESITLSDYFTVKEDGKAVYRPTVHYAYHPCDAAVVSVHEMAGRNWQQQPRQRLIRDGILSGMDELGVLLMGHAKGAYWYGSQLTIEEARQLAPHNGATTLQVTAGVLAGAIWAMENPKAGVVECEELDFQRIMEILEPYMGKMTGAYSDWTPLQEREKLFPEDLDREDPWQFKNFRVV
jgi:homospermidine synthase